MALCVAVCIRMLPSAFRYGLFSNITQRLNTALDIICETSRFRRWGHYWRFVSLGRVRNAVAHICRPDPFRFTMVVLHLFRGYEIILRLPLSGSVPIPIQNTSSHQLYPRRCLGRPIHCWDCCGLCPMHPSQKSMGYWDSWEMLESARLFLRHVWSQVGDRYCAFRTPNSHA